MQHIFAGSIAGYLGVFVSLLMGASWLFGLLMLIGIGSAFTIGSAIRSAVFDAADDKVNGR